MNSNLDVIFKKLYSDFAEGNAEAVVEACAPSFTFQIAGKSALAGKCDRESFRAVLMPRIQEHSQGTFQMEVHDVLVSDRHAMILCTNRVTVRGEKQEYRSVHVWRVENGKPLAGYEYLRDLYQFDAIWSR